MSAARRAPEKKAAAADRLALARQLLRGRLGAVLLFVLVLLSMAGAGRLLWQQIGPTVVRSENYRLDPQQIEITPQPAWIRANVKAEVVRDASLDEGLSILDDQLAERIAQAFAFHPWVAKVERVRKVHPRKVQVDLIYRRPVVMVSLDGSSNLDLLPLDAEGVHLPNSDFSPLEKRRFPRLVGIDSLPLVGQRATDPRVLGGAHLAALLGDFWHLFQLARIVPVPASDGQSERFELITRAGTRIIWGAAPGAEPEGEPNADEKLARLRRHLKEYGTLDSSSGRELNVRDVPTVPPTQRY